MAIGSRVQGRHLAYKILHFIESSQQTALNHVNLRTSEMTLHDTYTDEMSFIWHLMQAFST